MNILSYLMIFVSLIFWLFRVITAYTYSVNLDFIAKPLNLNIEIILLFISMICILFITRRNLLGAIAYLISYGSYFGIDVYNKINSLIEGNQTITDYVSFLISVLGILIPFIIFMDIVLNKNKASVKKNKKTDWFYTNEKYEREKDDRADDNQYKIN